MGSQEPVAAHPLAAFAGSVRIPSAGDRIFKDECFYSFDSPESKDGLYVCMEKFLGFGRKFVENYSQTSGRKVFLHMKRTKVPKEEPAASAEEGDKSGIPEKVSRMAIGVEGGFDVEAKKYDVIEENAIVSLPDFKSFSLDDQEVPLSVSLAAKGILSADSATRRAELEAASASWDGEVLKVSAHAENLLQLDNGVKIPPKGWKCSRCELCTNLWLNLTDGAINCGRRFFDGSGGNNHAVDHYNDTKYPLAVKLGTITADGKADVFSYPEDDMVEDPHLIKHLAHFGIDIAHMTKTDKSMAELEIDANQRANEWLTLTESGSKLRPVYGPGLTGMDNLGNTCYMNSVMQVLFTLPDFQVEYVHGADDVFARTAFAADHANNFRHQMCKLGTGLCSGNYSLEPEESEKKERQGIRPVIFKNMIGKGHREFSGKQQQDAQEFYLHLLTVMERENKKAGNASNAFKCLQFEVEDRHECGLTKKVKYMTRVEDYLPLAIPLESATNADEVAAFKARKAAAEAEAEGKRLTSEDVVRPLIPFEACLSKFCENETVEDFYSSAAKTKTVAHKTMRLKTFPDYLMIQLKKFDFGDNWVPYKLDVEVGMPDEIDLSALGTKGGLKDGEEPLPEDDEASSAASAAAAAVVEPSPEIVGQLGAMGFSTEACKKAAFHTNNAGVEAAMNWMMEHLEDPDLNQPFVNPSNKSAASSGGGKSSFVPNPDAMASLMAMSFSEAQAKKALKNTDNNVERAVDWIFSHPDDLGGDDDAMDQSADQSAGPSQNQLLSDGPPTYKLKAFISHMGTSHLVGHYVCHIHTEKDGWVIFNDEKVSLSENPPKGLGYLYLYQRVRK